MSIVKTLLLGTAAGLVAAASAGAADLPMRKAAPVEYVRICSAHGTGFFYIPGSETCLRISGRARAEYLYVEPGTRADNASGFRGRGRINIDARTDTAYGTLRTFIRYEATVDSGSYLGATPRTVEFFGLNKAFVQFAGITAGRVTSFFDFYANDVNFGGLPTGSDTDGADPVVFAYTASFGNGFSATIAVEDPAARRVVGAGGGLAGTAPVLYAGQRMPEIVGNIAVEQPWGNAQLSGAVHQIMALNRDLVGGYVDTEYGFAVQAGVKLNLPFLAPGDLLWLQAAYANGAVNYLGIGSGLTQRSVDTVQGDAFVDALGDVKKTEGFVLAAAILHYWTPQIRQGVFGSYGKLDYSSSVEAALIPGTGARAPGSVVDTTWWQIGTNLTWSPVADLDIGAEVVYRTVDPKGRVFDFTTAAPRTVSKDDAFEARLRVQRDF